MRDNTHAPMEMKHITPDVLMRLSIAFTSGSKFSQSLEKALELIGKISNHDRIYIIEVHHNMTYTITYNWHEKSLKAIPEEFRHNSLPIAAKCYYYLYSNRDHNLLLSLSPNVRRLTPGLRKKSNACKICPRLSLYNWIIINL